MNKLLKKMFSIFLFSIIALGMIPVASASTRFMISDVDFDDIAPGETIELEIDLENTHSTDSVEDITIKVWLEDKEGEKVAGTSKKEIYRIPADKERKHIQMRLPTDNDLDEDIYTLIVEAEGEWELSGNTVSDTWNDEIEVERLDYHLQISDVRFDSEVFSGQEADVAITVLNNGFEDEDDVKIEVSVPELSYKKKITVLNTIRFGTEYTSYLSLALPEADEGIYTLNVKAYSDDASDEYEKDFTLQHSVKETNGKKVKISISEYLPGFFGETQSNTIVAGKPSVFSIVVQNNQGTTKSYDMVVSGLDWATSVRVDPNFATLKPGESSTINVHLIPKENIGSTESFVLNVMDDDKVVSSARITTNVNESLSDLNRNLVYLFASLILILAVITAGWYWKQVNTTVAKNGKVEKVYY